MNQKLSIIIPHYNRPHYLRTLLLSIPHLEEIQVIVVDDKSTEYQQEYECLKKEFSDRNIEFYDNDEVKSAGTCRNIGLRHAAGDWLLFADSDDYFISRQASRLRQGRLLTDMSDRQRKYRITERILIGRIHLNYAINIKVRVLN